MNAPRLTPRGHHHAEAFCLMWYVCKNQRCGHRERIWNSRDGVTPFGMGCPSCGGNELYHAFFGSDEYAPNHKLHRGQRFWRDGTPDEAATFMQRRIESARGTEWECSAEKATELVRLARSGESHEFQQGWPMIAVYSVLGEADGAAK
jgi:hypothetical protein